MKTYLDCWAQIAADLFRQALAGEPELEPCTSTSADQNTFGYAATLAGDAEGRFTVVLEGVVLDAPLLGEGVDQKAIWGEVLRETFDAAAGELLAKTGKKCRVEKFEAVSTLESVSRAFQLKSGSRSWRLFVHDGVQAHEGAYGNQAAQARDSKSGKNVGLELLLDVELEASLRFGCRELPLSEILDLGPGDVVQLDRHVSDPVDLIVGDKIVARGEVVLVNGNFGLRVSEVAAPRKRLESIRCLF